MEIETPDLAWDGHNWSTEIALPEWEGFLNARGPYNSGCGTSDGRVQIVFAPEGRGDAPLCKEETDLVASFCREASAISHAVQAAVAQAYPAIRQQWSEYDDDYEDYMPALTSPEVIKRVIGLGTVYIHQLVAGMAPYAGFSLRCSWDQEHGLGVLMHGRRVVQVGGADTAFLLWVAERDARTQN